MQSRIRLMSRRIPLISICDRSTGSWRYIPGPGLSQSRFKMDSLSPEMSGFHGNRPIAGRRPSNYEAVLSKLGLAAPGRIIYRTVYFWIRSQTERSPMGGVSESLPKALPGKAHACETANQGAAASAVGWTVSSCSPARARARAVLFTVVHYFS